MTTPTVETLSSGAKVTKTDLFNKENIKNVINDLIDNEETVAQFRDDPITFLASIGIIISAEDLQKVTREEECSEKSGQRVGTGTAAVIVIVITLACPSPAH